MPPPLSVVHQPTPPRRPDDFLAKALSEPLGVVGVGFAELREPRGEMIRGIFGRINIG